MTSREGATTIYTRDFRLGEWLVRPSLNRLEHNGEVFQIEPKAMDVLVELAEHAGQVRSKNRLIRVVWGEAFVTDDVLTQAIRLLRRALGDDAKEPTYIETIPKRGYRLITPVTREPGHGEIDSQKVGHYRIVEKLGSGGMGVVYKAEDLRLKRTVALKFLPPELADDPERMQRLQREAETLAALNHSSIVTIHAIEREADQRFLVMEHVEGSTLAERVPERGFGKRELFDIAIRLADALSEAHEKGVVHRDLKPANIMLDARGRPKILDFGLAKLQPAERPEARTEPPTEGMTRDGRLLGTYPYMSPEQLGGKPADHRSDIFSLGAVLYELATGRAPFDGDSSAEVMSAILRDTPPPVDVERGDLPHHLSRILGRCLEKDPTDRYQRARALRKDLESLRREIEGGRTLPRKDSSITPRSGRRPLRLAGLLGAIAALIAAGITLVVRPWEKVAPPEPASAPAVTSLAVLPLENLSRDPKQEYFVDGMTDGLIADLSRISAVRVISRQSIMRYKDSDLSLPEIARELDVEALVEGSVLQAGDRVRINAQLVQASPETHLWTRTYEREISDVFTLLAEITREIADEIQIVVTPDERSRLAGSRDVHPDALKAYLKGEHLFGMLTPEEVMRSEAYFREAVEIDPSFALAWAGLAAYHQGLEFWVLPRNARGLIAQAIEAGDSAVAKALEIDENLARAHVVKGLAAFWRHWDWPAAESSFRRAVELAPSDSVARSALGFFLAAMGRCDEAIHQVELGERLAPRSQREMRLRGETLYYCHRFEQALEQYDRTLELYPDNVFVLSNRAWTLIALDRPDEAVKIWQLMRTWDGHRQLAEQYEGKSLEEVNCIYRQAATDPTSDLYSPFYAAKVSAENRETEEVFKWLEHAYAAGSKPEEPPPIWPMTFLKVDPDFLYLHSDPRFQDLLRRMNLAY